MEVPEFQGVFELDVRSHLLHRLIRDGSYEPELSELVLHNFDRHRDAIDVGANIGFFSVLMAKNLSQGCRVLAIEPAPAAAALLRANLGRNDAADQVLVFEGAAVAHAGERTLTVVSGREEYSSLATELVHPAVRSAPVSEHRVTGETLDQLVTAHQLDPGFIKIDVEGAEHLVLSGAEETLARFKPLVLCELSERLSRGLGSCSASVVAFLESHGYKVSDCSTGRRPWEGFEGDVLAVPAARTP